MAGDYLHEQESGGYQLIRDDTWAWYRLNDTLIHFVQFLRDVHNGYLSYAAQDYAYMMRWYDERLQ
jgi:hypothetical protein